MLTKESDRMRRSSTRELARQPVKLPGDLRYRLDAMVNERDLPRRCHMLAESMFQAMAERGKRSDSRPAKTVTLIYRTESGRARHTFAQVESTYVHEVISSQHVLLEDDQSLEVFVVPGRARRLRALYDPLRKFCGVPQSKSFPTTALLPPLHSCSPQRAAS
jgi:CopG family nickel-responsive transcriptional regulator